MFPTCSICLEDCIIPVEMTIFQCTLTQDINCYSFKRMCESCVITYLELDKKYSSRNTFKKCLFCCSWVNPQEIVGKTAYKKDYLLMSLDTRKLPCKNCDFVGNHLELEKHVVKECKKKLVECNCNVVGPKDFIESKEHRKACAFFKQCLECDEYIYNNDFENHLRDSHEMIVCQFCQKPTVLKVQEHLQLECSLRKMECKHCPKTMVANQYLEHLIEHTKDCKTRLGLLKDLKIKEMSLFQRLSSEIQELYQQTYGTDIED